ncbi:V-type proton ATPase subunit S1, luminal domain [Popillia japonica]|uniref:V-type proton ATPase subunit S1, luminal domain n=1 Tax=Popillia japonica TaxID=7064 RepID=A0AAW1KTW7_POPJA
MIRLVIASLFLFGIAFVSSEYVPVYIWETSKSIEAVPALPKISKETFKEIIQERLEKKSLVVIFAEPNLSAEDFGAVDESGNKIYSNLASIKASRTYLPSVDEPIDVLKGLRSNELSQTTIKDFNINDIKSSVVFVDLDDVQDNEDRNEILARHDKSISNIYNALQEKGDVFAIYTAYHTSWIAPETLGFKSRNVLQATSADTAFAWNMEGFLLYVSDVPYVMINSVRTNLTQHTLDVTAFTNASLVARLVLADQPTISFVFTFTGGYWTLTNVSIVTAGSETQLRVRDINAPFGFSYQCTNTVFSLRGNANTFLSLPGMQLQASTSAITAFGDPLYCIGFTTAPIWSGIFVTAILVTIMAIGLSMMMDIKTMDRFDDPKGKTIQINASE